MGSLREVFELVREQGGHGDPAGLLRDSGHTDLPEPLLSLAIVNFADTLPAAAAEHLAGFVVPHSGVPLDQADPPAADGLELLATAPAALEPEADIDGIAAGPDRAPGEAAGGAPGEPPGEAPGGAPGDHSLETVFDAGPDPAGLDFGTGDRGPALTAEPGERPEAEPAGDLEPEVPAWAVTPDGPAEPHAGMLDDRLGGQFVEPDGADRADWADEADEADGA